MACLTSAIEPLRAANEIGEKAVFQWQLISEDGTPQRSSAGVVFQPDAALDHVQQVDMLIVLAGPKSQPVDPGKTYGRLRFLSRHGTPLGAISAGVFQLARAGVTGGQLCSVHWCYRTAFENEFPDQPISDDVIVFGPNLLTASGAAAGFDMMLSVIETAIDAKVATEVACWFQHPIRRTGGVRQRKPSLRSEETTDALPGLVKQAIELFATHIEEPLPMSEVAGTLNVSLRQLERCFRGAVNESPARYYRIMRLRAARQLVRYTNRSMDAIAAAIGYNSTSMLIQNYKDQFGIRPTQDRARANSFRLEANLSPPSLDPNRNFSTNNSQDPLQSAR